MLPKSTENASPQCNILAVAPENTPFVARLQELRQSNPIYELVVVEDIPSGIKLLRRGPIAAVLLWAGHSKAGTAELMVEGLGKERVPRFVLLSDEAHGGIPQGVQSIRVVRSQMDSRLISTLLEQCCREFEAVSKPPVTPIEFFEALSSCPDQGWIRVSHDAGESGDFCIRNGRAVYCEVGRLVGENAASRLLSWSSCRLEYRDLPDFLQPNMDRSLADLRALQLSNAAFSSPVTAPIPPKQESPALEAPAPPQPPAATAFAEPIFEPVKEDPPIPPPAVEPEAPPWPATYALDPLEEPTEFPSLEEFAVNLAAARSTHEPAYPTAAPREPDEFSVFSPAPDTDIRIEEPLDLMFMSPSEECSEEPLSLPDFLPGAPAADLNSLLFASVAVISGAHLVSCNPPDDAGFYEAAALAEFFAGVQRYSRLHGVGDPDCLILATKRHCIAIGEIPGSPNLLGVRSSGAMFGDVERTELRRLQEVHAATYSEVLV